MLGGALMPRRTLSPLTSTIVIVISFPIMMLSSRRRESTSIERVSKGIGFALFYRLALRKVSEVHVVDTLSKRLKRMFS